MNFDPGFRRLARLVRDTSLAELEALASPDLLQQLNHGDLPRWIEILHALPELSPSTIELRSRVDIGQAGDCSAEEHEQLLAGLQELIPWRKGPLRLFGIDVDTEWRSDWKWERLLPAIQPLAGRRVLDVGCGNGYHCLRMIGEGASLAIGIDPHLAYVVQFWALQRYLTDTQAFVLPVGLEQFPRPLPAFDTVFSMGVLYHRRSPIDHLLELKQCLRKEGELVLETLVADGPEGYALTPPGRYGRMSNVWFVPSPDTTVSWLRRCGFKDVALVDISVTTVAEQRPTSWMPFRSLEHSLDPGNPDRTIEGLPAPRRAILTATA